VVREKGKKKRGNRKHAMFCTGIWGRGLKQELESSAKGRLCGREKGLKVGSLEILSKERGREQSCREPEEGGVRRTPRLTEGKKNPLEGFR